MQRSEIISLLVENLIHRNTIRSRFHHRPRNIGDGIDSFLAGLSCGVNSAIWVKLNRPNLRQLATHLSDSVGRLLNVLHQLRLSLIMRQSPTSELLHDVGQGREFVLCRRRFISKNTHSLRDAGNGWIEVTCSVDGLLDIVSRFGKLVSCHL